MSDTIQAKNRRINAILGMQRTSSGEIQRLLNEEAKTPWPTEQEPLPVPHTVSPAEAEARVRASGYDFKCGVHDGGECERLPIAAIMSVRYGYICACAEHLKYWQSLPPSMDGRTYELVAE